MTSSLRFKTRNNCPACGRAPETVYRCRFDEPPISTFLNNYYQQDLSIDGEYRIELCPACGTLFQGEVGTPSLLDELYSNWIEAIEPEVDSALMYDLTFPRLSRDGHEVMAAAAHLHIPLSELVTLDYGAGLAGWARVAKSFGCKSHSFDLAPNRQELAQAHGIEPDNDRYHFINTEQVMEHVTDPGRTVEELSNKLRPGGILKISVPSNRGAQDVLARLKAGQVALTRDEIMPIQPLEHVNCFTLEGLRILGSRFGLREVRPSYRHRFAFLGERGTLDFTSPKRLAKELIRPFWQWSNPSNLYVWLQKA